MLKNQSIISQEAIDQLYELLFQHHEKNTHSELNQQSYNDCQKQNLEAKKYNPQNNINSHKTKDIQQIEKVRQQVADFYAKHPNGHLLV